MVLSVGGGAIRFRGRTVSIMSPSVYDQAFLYYNNVVRSYGFVQDCRAVRLSKDGQTDGQDGQTDKLER